MKVIVKLPNAGLANKLLVWSKAIVFTEVNEVDKDQIIVYPWTEVHLNRLVRLKDRRFYFDYFKSSDFSQRLKALPVRLNSIEPDPRARVANSNARVLFTKIPSKLDYFVDIRGFEKVIREALFSIVNPSIVEKVMAHPDYDVALHVRRGDFGPELQTPISSFVEIHKGISNALGFNPKTLVFTDGKPEELSELLSIPNVSLVSSGNAIYDLLLMSKAKVIVPSIKSTFSYFASFISDAHILRHANDTYSVIRQPSELLFEGKFQKDGIYGTFPDHFIEKLNYTKV